jgi:hypothetical protein
MTHYAIFDASTGEILHLHHVVDTSGRFLDVPDHEVLAVLRPEVDRKSVRIAKVEIKPEAGKSMAYKIDPKTNELVAHERKAKK